MVVSQLASPSAVSEEAQVRFIQTRTATSSPQGQVFVDLAAGMRQEKGLLHPTPQQLQESFTDGDAVLGMHSQRAVGYARLEPLLTDRLRNLLGAAHCPIIMEAGSMFVSPEGAYRGKGHLNTILLELFETRAEQLTRGELLVIGTTKHIAVLKSLALCNAGAFVPCHHLEFPHVAALTCICTGSMGTGFHTSLHCPERIEPAIDWSAGMNAIPRNGVKIPCTMFVSSRAVAAKAEKALADACAAADGGSTLDVLRARLREIGFYPAATASRPVPLTVNGIES